MYSESALGTIEPYTDISLGRKENKKGINAQTFAMIPGWIFSSFWDSSSHTFFCALFPFSLPTSGAGLDLKSACNSLHEMIYK